MHDTTDAVGPRVLRVQWGGDPRRLCLTAVADLDLVSESRARAELGRALRRSGWQECLVDVSGVFVDLRGLAVLLDAVACAHEHGCRLQVAPSGSVLTLHGALDLGSRLPLVKGVSDGHGGDRA